MIDEKCTKNENKNDTKTMKMTKCKKKGAGRINMKKMKKGVTLWWLSE